MDELVAHVGRFGLLLVFANVLLEQLGAPIPALPTLVVAGALAARGEIGLAALLGVAVAASVLADVVWFLIGRRIGHRVLKLVCRISLSPDTCVRQTELLFERAGLRSLLFAKFIPGYSTVAPPLAGATRLPLGSFLLWDGLGSLLWAGSGVAVGMIFHRTIGRAVEYLETLGLGALVLIAVALALVVAWKWRERRRILKLLRLARISVEELLGLIDRGEGPLVVDVRTRAGLRLDPRRIPGALRLSLDEIDEKLGGLPRDRDIILYCT
jgi:membrane protein DedA with SNARE-associated domain